MKRIEKVEFYLSKMTEKQACDYGVLDEWEILKNRETTYNYFKQDIEKKGITFSPPALEWFFAKGLTEPEKWIEVNLTLEEDFNDLKALRSSGMVVLQKELDKILFQLLDNFQIIEDDKMVNQIVKNMLRLDIITIYKILSENYKKDFTFILSKFVITDIPFLDNLFLVEKE